MERGDVVTYDVTGQTGQKGMHNFLNFNGRVGVIVDGPYRVQSEYGVIIWRVQWIFGSSPENIYPTEFLRKIGHIDLPPDF